MEYQKTEELWDRLFAMSDEDQSKILAYLFGWHQSRFQYGTTGYTQEQINESTTFFEMVEKRMFKLARESATVSKDLEAIQPSRET